MKRPLKWDQHGYCSPAHTGLKPIPQILKQTLSAIMWKAHWPLVSKETENLTFRESRNYWEWSIALSLKPIISFQWRKHLLNPKPMSVLRKITPKTPLQLPSVCMATRYFSTRSSNSIVDNRSTAYYDDLIDKAGRERDFATVKQLLNERMRDGYLNTATTFKFISVDLSVLDDLLQTLASLDKGFPRKSSYDCLIAQLSRIKQTEEALRVAKVMVRNDYGANASSFHPILNTLTRKKAMDEAWRVVEFMRECKIRPDLTAFNYFLTAYCCAGDLNSAADLLAKMEKKGMGPDSRTYDALVLGACGAGKVDGALMMLRRMVDDGVPALYSTYAHIIVALLRNSCCVQAVEFVKSFAGKDRRLDKENFGLLVKRLIKVKRLDEALVVVEEMRKMGLEIGDDIRISVMGNRVGWSSLF